MLVAKEGPAWLARAAAGGRTGRKPQRRRYPAEILGASEWGVAAASQAKPRHNAEKQSKSEHNSNPTQATKAEQPSNEPRGERGARQRMLGLDVDLELPDNETVVIGNVVPPIQEPQRLRKVGAQTVCHR